MAPKRAPPGHGPAAIAGFGLFGAGLAAGAIGLAGIGSTAVTVAGLAFGAIAIFLGVTLLSPLAVRGVTGLFGWPMRTIAGVAGRLAQKNAARNPRRTATTAAALMIGLALVSTALVVGESVKATIGSTFEQSAKADYYLTDDLEEVEFPATLASEIRQSDVVAAATGFTHVEARVDGTVTDVVGLDFDQIDAVLDLDVRAGGFDRNVANPVVMSVDEATAIDASVGDVLTVEFANGCAGRDDDRRAVRRPDRPDRGLPDRHQRARRRRRRPDSRVVGRLDRRRRVLRPTSTRSSQACPTSSRTHRSRPRPSSVSGSRAWSTRC